MRWSDRLADVDRIADAADADHVAAALEVGVGMEDVVGHVLEDVLELLAGHLVAVAVRIGDRGRVGERLEGDRLARQQRAAPAEARRKRDLGVALGQHGLADQVVERAVEIAAPVEQRVRAAELARELLA